MAVIDHSTPVRGQYTLRSILILTACAAALCAGGTLMGKWSIGVLAFVFLCLANYLGFFAWFQRERFARIALYFAVALFVVSLFLPTSVEAHKSVGGYWGAWQVFSFPFEVVFQVAKEWFKKSPQFSPSTLNDLRISVACFLWTVANIALLISAFVARRLAVGKWSWYRGVLLIGVPSAYSLSQLLHYIDGWHGGLYVWILALTVPHVVLPIQPRELALVLMTAGIALWAIGPIS
ncbi:MAG: hypothetical protein K8T25_03885 [Planctomycetia bacterium]|nr:hypothetical protein [Planctomycetia bacterium]